MSSDASDVRVNQSLRYVNAAVLVVLIVGFAFVSGALASLRAALPASTDLITYRPRVTTEIYSTERQKDGNEHHTLLARIYKEDREPISLQDIPKPIIDATIAIEDHLFYRHRGVDPRGIARAVWVNLRGQSIQQGGSTITQQLARCIWLTQDRTLMRKMKEMLLAFEVERRFSKDEILEMYLNEVCYGHGAYGVKTAAKLYFGKDLKDLTLAQCALLAGLPQSPTWNSPYRRHDQAKMRQREVLQAMERYGYITQQQYQAADKENLTKSLVPLKEHSVSILGAPYFTHLVIQNLCTQYGQDNVYEGGLRVFTTLDVRLQEIADKYLSEGVEELRADGNLKGGLVGQGAMACVDVQNGDVLAMMGGVGPYEKTQFNRAQPTPPNPGRQPGSSMKPYIWATALESGYGPTSTFSGDPISVDLGAGKTWTPQNYTPHQSGDYTLREALAQSVNLVSVRVTRKVGLDKVRQYASRMLDIDIERLRPTWSLSLGASELSPLEQAAGYCCFASGGLRPKKRMWTRITDWRGDTLVHNDPEQVRVIQPDTAIDMIAMLHGVIAHGTGQRAELDYPAGGKTGTTQGERDVWWVGFTPDLCAAIWLGNDDNTPMHDASGGGLAAPIWAKFMKKAMEILGRNGKFPEGSGVTETKSDEHSKDDKPKDNESRSVTICVDSGGIAGPYCPRTVEKTLHPGERTPGPCTMHKSGSARTSATSSGRTHSGGSRTLTICVESGQIAGPYCPQTVEKTFSAGSGPSGTCTMHRGSRRGNGSGHRKSSAPSPDE